MKKTFIQGFLALCLLAPAGLAAKTYVVRVGTVSGTTFTEIYSETFTQNFDVGSNEFVTWTFGTPVPLSSNTVDAVDVGLTASTTRLPSGETENDDRPSA